MRLPRRKSLHDKVTAVDYNAILDALRSIWPRPSVDILPSVGAGGTSYYARARAKPGVQELEFPFQVVAVKNPASDKDPTAPPFIGVISNSHVFNSEDKDTYEEDNADWGLLNDDRTDGGFDVPAIGEKIWLEIKLSKTDQSIEEINLRHGPVGDTNLWDEYPDPISINVDDPSNPYQEFWNQIIAEVTDPEQDPRAGFTVNVDGESRQITQILFADLLMTSGKTTKDADQPNLPLLVALPVNELAGTSTDGSADPIPSANDIMTPWQFVGAAAPERGTPFEVVEVPQTATDPNVPPPPPKIGVTSNSHLFNSEDKDTYDEANADWGLLNADESAGAFDIPNIGAKIWLEIKLSQSDQSISEINLRVGQVGAGNLWDEYPDPISINVDDPNNPYQEFYNQIIAEVTDPDQDPRPGLIIDKGTQSAPNKVQITQLLFTNLMMTTAHTTSDSDQPNLPLLVAVPWNGPGTSLSGDAGEINSGSDIMTPFSLGDGGPQASHPFHLIDASNPTDGLRLRITSGVINEFLPNGMSPGDDPPYVIGVSGQGEVWIEVTTDSGGDPTSVTLNSGAIGATPADTDTTFYLTVGNWSDNGDGTLSVSDYLTGSQNFSRCTDWFANPTSYSAEWSVI